MVIKAKNTITLVRTDDGLPAYVHNAWSWSPDGTDRFTTVYPRENLILGSSDFSYGILGRGTSYTVKLNGADGYNGNTVLKTDISSNLAAQYIDAWSYRAYDATKAGKYTATFKAKASVNDASLVLFFYNPNTTTYMVNSTGKSGTPGDGSSTFYLTTEWKDYWVTWTQSETASGKSLILGRCLKGTQDIDFFITEPKLVEGETPTIYTPAPSEDPSNAYPHYMGSYSDNSPTASNNPADYTWVKIIGEQGPPTGITESTTIPTDPYYGMLWKHTGSVSSYIKNATYRWNGTTWELYLFTAENISASTLSAICANLGTVTAGTINGVNINGSIIKNTFKNWETGIEFGSAGSGLYLGGTTTIQDGRVEIESKVYNKSGVQISPLKMFKSSISDEGIKCGTYDNYGAKNLIQLMAGELSVVDLTGSAPRYAFLNVDDIIKLKNFNKKTRVILDAVNYEGMPYPTASNKYALGDTSKIRWIIINWAMYDPSAGTFFGLNQQSVIEYSSTSARGVYDFVLPYSANGGNTAIEMTSKRIRFTYENNVTYLQGDDNNMGNYSKWWLMRKLIVVEG